MKSDWLLCASIYRFQYCDSFEPFLDEYRFIIKVLENEV